MTARALLLLAAYGVTFPLFVLGPLAGLLLASRPASRREWLWIGLAGAWTAVHLVEPGGIARQTLQAWAFFVTAGFVVVMLVRRRDVVSGALLASLFGFGAVSLWVWSLGTRWRDIQLAVEHAGYELCRRLLADEALVAAERMESVRLGVDALAGSVSVMAELFPALLILAALPGLALAWSWYHRLATRPAGAPAARFAEFRFNDHLVWLVIVALAAWLVPLPAGLGGVAGNLALLGGGLYATRGAAVLWGSVEGFPLAVLVIMLLGVLFILPIAAGGCLAIGLADTWVDFRRRYAAADTEGSGPWK